MKKKWFIIYALDIKKNLTFINQNMNVNRFDGIIE